MLNLAISKLTARTDGLAGKQKKWLLVILALTLALVLVALVILIVIRPADTPADAPEPNTSAPTTEPIAVSYGTTEGQALIAKAESALATYQAVGQAGLQLSDQAAGLDLPADCDQLESLSDAFLDQWLEQMDEAYFDRQELSGYPGLLAFEEIEISNWERDKLRALDSEMEAVVGVINKSYLSEASELCALPGPSGPPEERIGPSSTRYEAAQKSLRNDARFTDVGAITFAINRHMSNLNRMPTSWDDIKESFDPGELGQYQQGASAFRADSLEPGKPNADGLFLEVITAGPAGANEVLCDAACQADSSFATANNITPDSSAGTGTLLDPDNQNRFNQIVVLTEAKCTQDNDAVIYGGLRRVVIIYRLEGQDGITCRDI